ncbi:MAG: SPFH domain-containing protein [Muribaculaceae bacterium]|nr:SPFH domain-containing protein [Muribaculaceae bacterium]
MGLFGRGKGGGLMNVIRCDLQDYLVWKWRPDGQELNSTSRENAIRWGSSLRVKDGELAVFVYQQQNGTLEDFILGPCDKTIETSNFPVLTSIIGMAYGGESPFQADIYFINLAKNVQIKFAVPYFEVADPRFLDFVVPVAAGGTITFNITDYREFIKLNRMQNFSLEDFQRQVKDAVIRRVKDTIANAPMDYGYPLVQIDRKIDEINRIVKDKLALDFENDFGVNLRRLDLSRIEIDKESEGWHQLRSATIDQQERLINAQTEASLKNLEDTQRINAINMEESLRVQREETQRAQRLQTESQFIGAHALNRQADVLETAAANLGQMSSIDGSGGNGGMNIAGLMAGMGVGGAVGGQMAGMMNNMGNAMNGQMNAGAVPPPPPGGDTWMIAVNGQTSGPFTVPQLQLLVQNGNLTPTTYVWKQGMLNWEQAGNVPELMVVFGAQAMPQTPPPPPGMPPVP